MSQRDISDPVAGSSAAAAGAHRNMSRPSQPALRPKRAAVNANSPFHGPTNPVGHHKQYVLLANKTPSTLMLDDTSLDKKARPALKHSASSKYIFSVDDNEDEVEADINREYLEGYQDGLRQRLRKPKNQAFSDNNSETSSLRKRASISDPKQRVAELEMDIASKLATTSREISLLRELEGDSIHKQTSFQEDGEAYAGDLTSQTADGAEEYAGSDGDNESISSVESFTLRERQDAINSTHPFGIRIWKPAIYKKVRSVEREADLDIHSDAKEARKVHVWVSLCNYLWSLTFGLFLFLICLVAGLITVVISLALGNDKDSLKYGKLYIDMALYLLYPFGKLLLLHRDQRYFNEDAGEGSSLVEYRRWRTQEEGRLFYAPQPKRGPFSETSPLVQTLNGARLPSEDEEDEDDVRFYKKRWLGRGRWCAGRVVFYLVFYLFIEPVFLAISLVAWLGVFTIPMAKIITIFSSHIRRHPLGLIMVNETKYHQANLESTHTNDSILICTYRSFGLHYYKYTVDGTNIFFINLIFLVGFVIFDFYFIKEYLELDVFVANESLIFALCLISVIPLAYFIGQAVASISAQTSMGLGAVINAFFSTVVEVFLYCVALNQGKGKLVEGSMIGSILGAVLLLPGMSMCGGAIKRKTQRYNPNSAGVSSTMLLFATLTMLSPTVLYQIYGRYQLQCSACEFGEISNFANNGSEKCQRCHFIQPPLAMDELYTKYLKPYSILCAIFLFTAYCIGLWFTLRTHAALIWTTPVSAEKPKEETNPVGGAGPLVSPSPNLRYTEPLRSPSASLKADAKSKNATQPAVEASGGHDAPNWSRSKSTAILLGATLAYAIIAEILVDCVDVVLSEFPINPKFLGLTVFALVPNTTEFVNAISFAMNGNVALSMEIGSAYVLQVCLLQIPALVIYSIVQAQRFSVSNINNMFTLIFPQYDFISCLMAVFLFVYVYAEGKSNYFKGSVLILLYLVLTSGFYAAIEIDSTAEAAF
ncbi:unnamed protein product [Kuraishia capsulata CBS 1993]|uniref:Sodium/calcium exchanger membrane region domain-containing protein n=1 Tax=Kuraishia capsulata CBS 1993 TaxID=1382522 RepID=W6MJJ0_9ASCO|nr:uncharacterized protein KUCA_T00002114001 [Kuraishia capsulata CBS 1993]CDK26143.1 unnamed protein product [Kuraishia capsulata CBS 1993]